MYSDEEKNERRPYTICQQEATLLVVMHPNQDMYSAQAAIRAATTALLAAEMQYQAAIARSLHLLGDYASDSGSVIDADSADVHSTAAAYGAAAARLRAAY